MEMGIKIEVLSIPVIILIVTILISLLMFTAGLLLKSLKDQDDDKEKIRRKFFRRN